MLNRAFCFFLVFRFLVQFLYVEIFKSYFKSQPFGHRGCDFMFQL